MKFSHLSLYKHHDKVSDDKGCPKQNDTTIVFMKTIFFLMIFGTENMCKFSYI